MMIMFCHCHTPYLLGVYHLHTVRHLLGYQEDLVYLHLVQRALASYPFQPFVEHDSHLEHHYIHT